MSLIYITGPPGVGKSTIETTLHQRGYVTYDIDNPRFGGPINKTTGKSTTVPAIEDRDLDWFDQHEWRVSRSSIEQLKVQAIIEDVYLCGTASTDGLVLDLFDKVFYLKADEATLRSRIANRDNGNDFGKTDDELQLILTRRKLVEDNLDADTIIIDAAQSIGDIVDTILSEVSP